MAVTREKIHYLAYGSNLHPVRLGERTPSARLLGVVQLNTYCIRFHKRGQDGSSKCNLLKTATQTDMAYGALYEIDPAHKDALDRFEGRGNGYQDCMIQVDFQREAYQCLTYIAEDSHIDDNLYPYHWYKNLVVLGAIYLKFPHSYVNRIHSVESMQDKDTKRRRNMEILIQKIISYV